MSYTGSAGGHGRRISETAWTGEKRRKTVGAPSSSLGQGSSFSMMDAQVQEEEEDLVFSAEYSINVDELTRCYYVLSSREHHIHPSISPRLNAWGARKVTERFYQYRYRDVKLKEGTVVNLDDITGTGVNLDDITDTVPLEYPEVFEWDNPHEPGRSMFDWTFDPKTFDLADLDDYQRMVPKRASFDEYHQWEKYCLAFSNYETDEEYVKYWDELFKKLKWIEDYIHLMHDNEFDMYRDRGASQAMQIAERFCHLPASLVTLGYNEFIDALHDNFDLLRKDYGRVYLGLWKRVTKQGMSIQDALQDILASDNKLPLSCSHRIKSAIMGYDELLENFLICKKHIGKHIVDDDDDDDTVLKHINDALRTKVERRKWYVDYAKMKLEIARRICMLPGRSVHPKL